MRKSAPIEVVVHYPKTKEGWDELGKRVATAHANYVIEKIDRLNCPTWHPRNTKSPAGSRADKQSTTLNICFSAPTRDGQIQRQC